MTNNNDDNSNNNKLIITIRMIILMKITVTTTTIYSLDAFQLMMNCVCTGQGPQRRNARQCAQLTQSKLSAHAANVQQA